MRMFEEAAQQPLRDRFGGMARVRSDQRETKASKNTKISQYFAMSWDSKKEIVQKLFADIKDQESSQGEQPNPWWATGGPSWW